MHTLHPVPRPFCQVEGGHATKCNDYILNKYFADGCKSLFTDAKSFRYRHRTFTEGRQTFGRCSETVGSGGEMLRERIGTLWSGRETLVDRRQTFAIPNQPF